MYFVVPAPHPVSMTTGRWEATFNRGDHGRMATSPGARVGREDLFFENSLLTLGHTNYATKIMQGKLRFFASFAWISMDIFR